MTAAIHPPLVAVADPHLRAVLDNLVALRYTEGALPSEDLPTHVRSASSVRRLGQRLVIVQDDVNALAVCEAGGRVRPLLLPRGQDGRRRFDDTLGNKRFKMDLEACAALPDGRLVAFGSGASPARETLVVVGDDERLRLVHAPGLYERLRAEPAFVGPELNVEGAVALRGRLLLFQRATGARRGGVAVNAIAALDLGEFLVWLDGGGTAAAAAVRSVTPVELGSIDGVKLGFTAAAVTADGRLMVLACAERSRDALHDGPVMGCRCGIVTGSTLRMTDVLDSEGRPVRLKLEGLEAHGASPNVFHAVADLDRPEEPSLLGRLRFQDAGR